MALTKAQVKEILSEAGADGEKIADAVQKILDGHVATIEALKEERDSLKKEIEANKADLEEYEKLKKNNGDIEALRKEYDDFKANVEAEKIKTKKETAYREILKDVGIPERHFPKILKYSDVNGIEFDEEGNVKGADEIRIYLKHYLKAVVEARDKKAARKYSRLLHNAISYIDENYANDDISLNTVASTVNISPNHFSTIFSQEVGQTFIEYLIGKRMERAKELLMTTDMRSSEIAYAVGYKDPHYFSYTFKKTQGMTSREFRARGKAENV